MGLRVLRGSKHLLGDPYRRGCQVVKLIDAFFRIYLVLQEGAFQNFMPCWDAAKMILVSYLRHWLSESLKADAERGYQRLAISC